MTAESAVRGARHHSIPDFFSNVVSCVPSSATKIASRLAGSVVLAFSLTRCSLPAGSKNASPA
jgi:hypothetical protein